MYTVDDWASWHFLQQGQMIVKSIGIITFLIWWYIVRCCPTFSTTVWYIASSWFPVIYSINTKLICTCKQSCCLNMCYCHVKHWISESKFNKRKLKCLPLKRGGENEIYVHNITIWVLSALLINMCILKIHDITLGNLAKTVLEAVTVPTMPRHTSHHAWSRKSLYQPCLGIRLTMHVPGSHCTSHV